MPDAKTSEPDQARERRRLRAWELHQQGWSQGQIAKALGITQGAVSQWLKRSREGGVEALRRRPAPGRQTALTDRQLAQIPGLIARGAAAFGFQDDRWTLQRVASVLEQNFGVSYHPGHVSRLLRKHCPNWRDQKQNDRR